MVDVGKDARWGRIMEGAGEDPYYCAQVSMARVKGFQGDDLSRDDTIAATAKHFAGYAYVESGREYNTVEISSNTLYNDIFPPFMACIKAGVKTFMTAFNELNGIPSTGHQFLLREVLQKQWQFDGVVVSDWGSVFEMITHGFAKNEADATKLATSAGCDIDMESQCYINHLKEVVEKGIIPEKIVDDAVSRILTLKFELGLFDDPYRYCIEEREGQITGHEIIKEACLDMAKKSIVLLKNEGSILPLQKQGLKIGLIGPLANNAKSPLGSWTIAADEEKAITVYEGLLAYGGNTINYSKGIKLIETEEPKFTTNISVNNTDYSGMDKAIEVAKHSDVVIMVLGEHAFQSGEARSRTNIGLPGLQQKLLEAVYQINKNIVLILLNGRPLAIPWAAEYIPAIVEAWQPGSQGGKAIAEILYGDYNPSGKLPVSFPRSVGQVPLSYRQKNTGRPRPKDKDSVFYSNYIDQQNSALYPFGYGLSYTTFSCSDVSLSKSSIRLNETLKVMVTVTNTGNVFGKEIVQLYIRDEFASTIRPTKELKDFRLIELNPGESKTVNFRVERSKLEFYNNHDWVVEPGNFLVFIGPDSTTNNKAKFTVKE